MIAARWQALSERDRRILLIGSIVSVLLLGWAFVWHPLALKRAQLESRVANERTSLAWMRKAQTEVPSLTAHTAHATADRQGKSLLALADVSARGAGLAGSLKRVEPAGGARSVRVSFEAVNFDALMAWIEALARDYGVEATDFSVDRAEGVGLVNARVTLEDR